VATFSVFSEDNFLEGLPEFRVFVLDKEVDEIDEPGTERQHRRGIFLSTDARGLSKLVGPDGENTF
jgi:hypothetical protein